MCRRSVCQKRWRLEKTVVHPESLPLSPKAFVDFRKVLDCFVQRAAIPKKSIELYYWGEIQRILKQGLNKGRQDKSRKVVSSSSTVVYTSSKHNKAVSNTVVCKDSNHQKLTLRRSAAMKLMMMRDDTKMKNARLIHSGMVMQWEHVVRMSFQNI